VVVPAKIIFSVSAAQADAASSKVTVTAPKLDFLLSLHDSSRLFSSVHRSHELKSHLQIESCTIGPIHASPCKVKSGGDRLTKQRRRGKKHRVESIQKN
jgi:hypothetical protein